MWVMKLSAGAYSFFYPGGACDRDALTAADSNEVEFAGKFGGSVAVSEKASVYGELSGMTGDELQSAPKLGI